MRQEPPGPAHGPDGWSAAGLYTREVSADREPHGSLEERLERFVVAQESGATYARALAELRGGSKQSHWMWFVFPQLVGLGRSETSRRYAIQTLAEARAYLDHPLLGARLLESATALCRLEDLTAEAVLGEVDAQKLRSSMTLFLRARPGEPLLAAVLERYFDGRPDELTERLLAGGA
jgi:uncharacterized protein (DUF1810 family)